MNLILVLNILTFLGINVSNIFAMTSIESCITPSPENARGWCIPIAQCKILADISDLPLSLFPMRYDTFIRNSNCSDQIEEKYCCVLQHIDPEFAKINNLINSNGLVDKSISNSKSPSNFVHNPILDTPNSPSINTAGIENHQNLQLLGSDCGDIPEKNKVSNGEAAGLNEFPFMAHLQYEERSPFYACGGSLINERYVLTAAHCITPELFSVRLGDHNVDTEIDCEIDEFNNDEHCNDPPQDIKIESRITHSEYVRFAGVNDIALIRLSRPANMTTNNVRSICLPITADLRNADVKTGQISGWGGTEKNISSNILQVGTLLVNQEREKCENSYLANHSVKVTDRVLCAKGKKNVDSCKGDSGGPLFNKRQLRIGEIKKYIQYGIVASGPPIRCGDTNAVGGSLYTNVPKFMNWILDNLIFNVIGNISDKSMAFINMMGALNFYKIYFIIVFLCKSINLNEAQYQTCKTPTIPEPTELDGLCVSKPECKSIFDIVKRDPKKIPQSILIYLVKANCGTFNGISYICCKDIYLSSNARKLFIEAKEEESSISLTSLRQPRISDRTINKETVIEEHPNIALLPKECQVLQLTLDDRISNGNDAALEEFRFIALTQYETSNGEKSSFYCGGSLISIKYVLTAAHCASVDGIILKSVILGEYNTKTNPDCTEDGKYCTDVIQNIPVEEKIIHENYNIKQFANDIALLRLAEPANLNVRNVATICLPIYSELRSRKIEDTYVAGWGATEKHHVTSILQKAAFSITDHNKCKLLYRRYNIRILESHICAGGENNIDACRGDSGGPLFSLLKFGKNFIPRYVQYGVVSGGTAKCGTVSFPGLYSNVSFHMKWILDNMKE
ncbi:uncharacterized protein LOC129612005 [Condylostylus longicornis]|uniref:uncharacterized protein LOC129612005 n=1 Tax=Condylostylus longicornis TaxID=2530218 RepID=UPI00244E4F14|nr:uncharacterized protein LOC129612005 [Condylostylus longicornis]